VLELAGATGDMGEAVVDSSVVVLVVVADGIEPLSLAQPAKAKSRVVITGARRSLVVIKFRTTGWVWW